MTAFFTELFASLGLAGLSTVLGAILVFLICLVAIRLITRLAENLLGRSARLEGTLKGFILSALRIALWALAVVIIAQALGIPTASLVAVISIAGLALSLSVQNILSNLFAGITLLLTHPFVQGDFVDVGGNTGTVQSVGLIYTVINTLDNRVVSMPNSTVTSGNLVNYSRAPLRRVDLTFCTSYDDPTETVRAAILEAVRGDEKILLNPPPFIVIGQYKDSCIEYIVRVWCKNADYWGVYFGMNERVRESFARNGVHMTYNHLNVHISAPDAE